MSGLDEAQMSVLAPWGGPRRFGRGDHLLLAGEPADGLFIITSGAVRLYSLTPGGDEQVREIAGPGDCLGECSLIDNSPQDTFAQAITETTALVIARSAFQARLAVEPAFATAVARVLAGRLHRMTGMTYDVLFLDARRRLIKQIVYLSERFPHQPLPPMRQQELASLVGASRETASRVVSELEEMGLIHTHGREVWVTDLPALRRLAGAPMVVDGRGLHHRRLEGSRVAAAPELKEPVLLK